MKKVCSIVSLCVCSLVSPALALCQSVPDTLSLNGLRVTDVTFKGTVEDSLLMNMRLSTSGMDIGGMDRVTIIPMLTDDFGNAYEFNPLVVDGKRRSRVAYREALLGGKAMSRNSAVSVNPVSSGGYLYNERLPLASWMKNSRLVLKSVCDCCGKNAPGTISTIADSLEFDLPAHRYVVRPRSNFVVPEAEPIKRRVESGNARLEFLSGKSTILPAYKNNQIELDKIGSMITSVLADSMSTVDLIVLKAYSSPEGSYASNARLAAARSVALKNYLEASYGLKGVRVETSSVPEDWDTLEALIRDSDLAQKQQFLDIIAENSNPDRREQLFKSVGKGVPYRRMLAELFPLLRRTDYQLSYSVKDFTVEQGREVIKTRPGQLSLNEMYHVANSYEIGSEEFKDVFDVAVRVFPEDPVANINAGAVALLRGDTLSASKYLSRVKDDPRAQNNLGVLYLLEGDLEQASRHLKEASSSGLSPEEVEHNNSELTRKERDNALFDKYTKQ